VILVLRALGVGDLATAVPALRGLRAAFPGERLILAAPAWLAPLVDLVGGVDRLVPTDGLVSLAGLARRRWPGPAARLAVNLHGRGPESHRLLSAARPGRLWAFANPAAGHPEGPQWRAQEHEVHRWCRMLRWYGIPTDPADLALRTPDGRAPRAGLTIVHPGAKARQRRWPARRFAEVARALTRQGHAVVITGSAAESRLASDVAKVAGLPEAAVLAGHTDVGQLAGLVAGARLLVSGDTGVAHLATGYGTPSVVLFASMSPALWGPPANRPWHRALWHAGLAHEHAGPAYEHAGRGPHPGLLAITVAEVLAAVRQVEAADATRTRARHAVAAQ
jgi:ADP-heptose:LPS heptosyltransferase